ncbi:FecR family protein [Runella sp.]|uniref:FecR family protein n=1 Tax=Runella sp. TaxID=1960881 RepID=UPI003D13093D
MIDYTTYTAEALALDELFRAWVLENAEPLFWENWLIDYPEKAVVVQRAKQIVLTLYRAQEEISEDEIDEAIQQLVQRAEERAVVVPLWRRTWVRVAAALILVPLAGWLIYRENNTDNVTPYQEVVQQIQNEVKLIEFTNTTSRAQLVTLSDGSSVVLQPQTRISYPTIFPSDKREVVLSGEAFFEVSKDPAKPFFVFANGLVTKVLGTTFTVQAYEKDREVRVIVKTGKVSVFSREDPMASSKQKNRELTGLVLTPNQQVTFHRADSRLVRSLVEKPQLLALSEIQQQSFEFRQAPISDVFAVLEKAYGVKIVYDEELMGACELTATLGDEPLLEKMHLICKVLEANYELMDAQIVVNGKGCK